MSYYVERLQNTGRWQRTKIKPLAIRIFEDEAYSSFLNTNTERIIGKKDKNKKFFFRFPFFSFIMATTASLFFLELRRDTM